MKTRNDIEAEVCDVISTTLNIPAESITATQNIVDLSSDSIRLFELLVAFEKKYDMKARYDDIVSLDTVDDIFAYIERTVYAA